jgi:ATP phosphoribosyltransferase regulatory subunit
MIYQPPAGARDLLPLDVAQKCWIEQRLQQVFHRWSYHRIITPTLERLDTLMAGGAIQLETVMQLREAEEGVLGLRPELTASIARAAVTRMAGVTYPQRLYYNANVFQQNQGSSASNQQEFYQAGVELLGRSGLLADAEVLLLLSDCLNALGLDQWHLILGEAELTRSLLSPFPAVLQDQVRHCIAQLDRVALEALPLSPDLQRRALLLFDLRGKPANVLQKVASLDLELPQREVLNNLKSLIELLGESFPLTLDLSLIQTLDYYTGIVFEVISNGDRQRVLGRGGRYDQLLSLYHPRGEMIPGIGFALNIEDLHQVLLPTDQLPHQTPTSDWLVVPENPQAFAAALAYAQHLRADGTPSLVRVELDLAARAPESVRAYAQHRRIPQIAWVKAEGSPLIESIL